MATTNMQMMAVCGLDCGDCDLRKVPTYPEAAERVVVWFSQMDWLNDDEGVAEIIERSMYCKGCRGDRSVHWSPDCWILKCCVDDKGLSFCYECDAFPCAKLSEWAEESEEYTRALERLRNMRAGAR